MLRTVKLEISVISVRVLLRTGGLGVTLCHSGCTEQNVCEEIDMVVLMRKLVWEVPATYKAACFQASFVVDFTIGLPTLV